MTTEISRCFQLDKENANRYGTGEYQPTSRLYGDNVTVEKFVEFNENCAFGFTSDGKTATRDVEQRKGFSVDGEVDKSNNLGQGSFQTQCARSIVKVPHAASKSVC
jgi:hypothetical protein